MGPLIHDGDYLLFRANPGGTRQGKIVLVQCRGPEDPDTGGAFTVKRYRSEKTATGHTWRHARVTLGPISPDFEPIVLTGEEEGDLQVIAELIRVLGTE